MPGGREVEEARSTHGALTCTPHHNVYLATRENGKLKIIGPGGEEVKEAMSSDRGTTFTSHTLADHLGWIKVSGSMVELKR